MSKSVIKTKKTLNELYISLGSNIENRLDFIEKSIDLIDSQVGSVIKKALVYETPAWGFISTPFLNTCICITTKYSTKEALFLFQNIEKELGRKTKTTTAYEARPIDIDIIYTSEGIFNTPNLIVPHPLMQKRLFVLMPLLDIAKHYQHPLLNKNTTALIEDCKDDAVISVFKK